MLTKKLILNINTGESIRICSYRIKIPSFNWGFFLLFFIMKIEMPKTLEDFRKVRETILELMANPYCDHFMFLSLSEKLNRTDAKIEEMSKK